MRRNGEKMNHGGEGGAGFYTTILLTEIRIIFS